MNWFDRIWWKKHGKIKFDITIKSGDLLVAKIITKKHSPTVYEVARINDMLKRHMKSKKKRKILIMPNWIDIEIYRKE